MRWQSSVPAPSCAEAANTIVPSRLRLSPAPVASLEPRPRQQTARHGTSDNHDDLSVSLAKVCSEAGADTSTGSADSRLIRFRLVAQLFGVCAMSLACTQGLIRAAPPSDQGGTEMVITAEQFGRVVTISIGQTFVIRRPLDVEEWQVDFATDILEVLNSADRRQSPGPEGWRFRAIGIGETDLALTERPPRNGGAPPPPRRFVVTIRVTR